MSIDQMSARGCGLRSVAPHSIPSTFMSDEYSNSPLTFGMPSTRVVVTPISFGRWIGAGVRSRVGRVSGTVLTASPPPCPRAGGSRGRCPS